MSTGTKRPLEDQLLHCTASPSASRLPKRRKQSTPVRIPGGPHDPGPDNNDLQNINQNENYTVDFAALEQDETNDDNFETIFTESSPSQSIKDGDESAKKDNLDDDEDENGLLGEYKPNRVDNNCHNIEQNLIKSKGYIEKYKEHLNDQDAFKEYDQIKKNNAEIDRLNAYRIKAVSEPKGTSTNGNFIVGDVSNNYVDDEGSVGEQNNMKKLNNINITNSVIVDRPNKEDKQKTSQEQIIDEQNKLISLQHSLSNDSEKYAMSALDRCPCRKCGIVFQNIEQLKMHFENEHNIERNGKQDYKSEPYETEENNSPSGSGATSTPLTNIPDPRLEAWGTDFQAKMADLYKNALGFQHDMQKDSLPTNFSPLCPPFPIFPQGVPPQRPLMEPIRIFNPEAYCELCSKEFCNKYFLKTHKANKHGIYENNPSGSGADGLNLDSSFMPNAFAASALKFKNNLMLADYAKSYEVALLASQRHKAKIQKMVEEAQMEKNNTDAQTISMHANVNSRQAPLDDVRSSSDDNTIPENFIFKGDRPEQEEPFMTPTPRKLSPDSSKRAREAGFSADILRRLGVINPEAFCKICCKEYCNKYFLKTHKIKRHGLLPSPTDKLSMKEQIHQPANSERKDGQTSPLNLIMADESPSKRQPTPEQLLTPIKLHQNKDLNSSLSTTMNQTSNSNGSRPLSTQSIDSTATDCKRDSTNEDSIKSEIAKTSPTTIFISEDLQKLQTMISQLNDLSVNKIVECYVCKKEFDNNYVLQFHMMSDHGLPMPGSVENFNFPSGSGEDISGDGSMQQKPICTICEKEFPSMMNLKKHIEEFHTPKMNFGDIKSSMDSGSSDKEASLQRERRASMSLTPTNSYCEICNKELCNKYFMKTHMQRMHGIEIENGTQIGGVICDICNKELCSKYFLRVHKHNTHGIVEPGAPLPQIRGLSGDPEAFNPPPAVSPLKPPSEASILSNRFIAHFIEVCPFCSRRFRTSKWLKAHLLSDHGKAGIDKWKELEMQYKIQAKAQQAKTKLFNPLSIPEASSMSSNSQSLPLDLNERLPLYSKMVEPKLLNMFNMNSPDIKTYNCSYCPFTTSILSFLYVHEKSHIQGPEMDILCPMCPESFGKPEALQFHIITSHSLPEWRDRSELEGSPTSVSESISRQKTPELMEQKVQPISGNGKAEIFDCYECDYKTCSFSEMETHLRSQHYAIRDGAEESRSNMDAENNIEEDRRKPKIPAIYAVPRDIDIVQNESSITMQPFVIEENSPEETGGKFVPSVVFLPVRRRATGAITISFNLTPA